MEDKFKLALTAAEVDRRIQGIGDLSNLKTNAKNDLISAINELKDKHTSLDTMGVPGDTIVIPDGYVETDKTLTVADAAADAKAVGDRLSAIEYQAVLSDSSYTHTNLPEGTKTATFEYDDSWGDTAYINYGIDLFPRGGFTVSEFPVNGLTITQSADTFTLTGRPTVGTTIYFINKQGQQYIEIPEELVGKTLNILRFNDNIIGAGVYLNFMFYDAAKKQISKKTMYLASGGKALSTLAIIPEDACYYGVSIQTTTLNTELYHKTKLYILVSDTIEKISLVDSLIKEDILENSFSTIPYKSAISYKIPLTEYISRFSGIISGGGIHIGSGEMPPDCNIQIDPDGDVFEIDETLTIEGAMADAKAVGDRLAALEERLNSAAAIRVVTWEAED